jgi:hypothetical protein
MGKWILNVPVRARVVAAIAFCWVWLTTVVEEAVRSRLCGMVSQNAHEECASYRDMREAMLRKSSPKGRTRPRAPFSSYSPPHNTRLLLRAPSTSSAHHLSLPNANPNAFKLLQNHNRKKEQTRATRKVTHRKSKNGVKVECDKSENWQECVVVEVACRTRARGRATFCTCTEARDVSANLEITTT